MTTLKQALKGQLAVAAADTGGTLKYLTGVQIAGVLDDLYYYSGLLGAVFHNHEEISIHVLGADGSIVEAPAFPSWLGRNARQRFADDRKQRRVECTN